MTETKHPDVVININTKNASRQDPEDKPIEAPGDLSITRWRTIEGFQVCRKQPFGHWFCHTGPGGFVPQQLQGAFTTVQSIEKAITEYIGKPLMKYSNNKNKVS